MDKLDLDELFANAGRLGQQLKKTYRDMTGEDLDIDAVVAHYPVLALGIALGVGAISGWWLGQRRASQLPPPVTQKPTDVVLQSFRELRGRANRDPAEQPARELYGPLGYLETVLPGSIEAIRTVLPVVTSPDVAEQAQTFMDTFVEPKLREGLDDALNWVAKSRFASFFMEPAGDSDSETNTQAPPDISKDSSSP